MEHDPTLPAGVATASGAPCVAIDELVAMASGALPPERVDSVLEHVDRCATCAEVIAHLGTLDETPRDGRYQLGRALGAGAMGIVYEAWDTQLRRRVALKVVRPERADPEAQARMLREARALARVSHPNVVTVYDAQEDGGRICIATELVDGETLATWQPGRTPDEIVDAWLQAARGLAAAHAVGVVHRDIKPANVLVGRDGRVRVGDFGLARLGPEDASRPSGSRLPSPSRNGASVISMPGVVAGTPAYMAPEQADGIVDARSDQYALCVALAEALTGVRPARDEVPAIDDPKLREVVALGLRGDPAQRFPTTDALVDALVAATAPPRPRRWPLVAGGAIAALAIGAGTIAFAMAPAETCELAAPPAGLWPAPRRAAIVHDLGESVARRVDVWLAAWSAAAADVCADQRSDAALRLRRRRCLLDAAVRMDFALGRLTPKTPMMQAHLALEDLPQPTQCSASLLAHGLDPTAAQEIQIAPIRARMLAGGAKDHAEFARWLAAARAIGYVPFVAEVADALAAFESNVESSSVAAARTLRDTAALADQAGDDLSWIAMTIELIPAVAKTNGREADAIGETVRARIAKIGGNRDLEATLDMYLGAAYGSQHRNGEQIEAYERARAAFHLVYGPASMREAVLLYMISLAYASRDGSDSPDAAKAWVRVSAMYRQLGVPDPPALTLDADPRKRVVQLEKLIAALQIESADSANAATFESALAGTLVMVADLPGALGHAQRAVAILDKLGLRDRHLASSLIQVADITTRMHHPADALVPAQRAVDLAEAIDDDSLRADTLTGRGRALLESGDDAAARPILERASDLAAALHEPARARGDRRFLLARATWRTDHRRAHELATAARLDLETALATLKPDSPFRAWRKNDIAEIDHWFADHR